MPITRLLIANRGEIAVRIIRAARELGIHTIQAVSTPDKDSLAARMAYPTLQAERFLVLNAIPAGTTRLAVGRKVKLVVWGPARKY